MVMATGPDPVPPSLARLAPDADPPVLIAELGVAHLGSSAVAMQLALIAKRAGFDLVKLQLRTPELSIPTNRRNDIRQSPWGPISHIRYRTRMEFSDDELAEFDGFCAANDIAWIASCWDGPALARLLSFDPPAVKIPSARLRDQSLLTDLRNIGRPIILSTGMARLADIQNAVETLAHEDVLLAHTVSVYPTPPELMNLRAVRLLTSKFPNHVVGYSAHHTEAWPSCIAVAYGAAFVEHHITLSRQFQGSDQSSSLEPGELHDFVSSVRAARRALGTGEKRLNGTELETLDRLRGAQ